MAWARIQTGANAGATTLTVSLPAGTGRKIFIDTEVEVNAALTISAFTFGGSACTLISDGSVNADPVARSTGVGNFGFGYYFDIPDAWSGNKDISITYSATVSRNTITYGIYTGVATGNADVVQQFTSLSATTNTLNITPTASVGVIMGAAGFARCGTWTHGAGQTELQDLCEGTNMSGTLTEKGYTSNAANSTADTQSASAGRLTQWAAAFSESGGGGGGGIEILRRREMMRRAA